MESELNLSDKIVDTDYSGTPYNLKEKGIETSDEDFLIVKDVREFIKRSKGKAILGKTLLLSTDMREEIGNDEWINVKDLYKLAGNKLV